MRMKKAKSTYFSIEFVRSLKSSPSKKDCRRKIIR